MQIVIAHTTNTLFIHFVRDFFLVPEEENSCQNFEYARR